MKGRGPVHFLKEVRFSRGTGWVIFFWKGGGRPNQFGKQRYDSFCLWHTTVHPPPGSCMVWEQDYHVCFVSQCGPSASKNEHSLKRFSEGMNEVPASILTWARQRNPVPIAKPVLRALEYDEIKVLDFLYTETSTDMIKIHNKPCIMRSITPASFGPFINLTFTWKISRIWKPITLKNLTTPGSYFNHKKLENEYIHSLRKSKQIRPTSFQFQRNLSNS